MRLPSPRLIFGYLLNRWVLCLWLPLCLLIAVTCAIKLYQAHWARLDAAAWQTMNLESHRVRLQVRNYFYLTESEIRARLTPGQELRLVKHGPGLPLDFYFYERIFRLVDPKTTDLFYLGFTNGTVRSVEWESPRTPSHEWLHDTWFAIAIRLPSITWTFMGCWIIALLTMLAMWRWHRLVGQIALALAILCVFASMLDNDPDSLGLFRPKPLKDHFIQICFGMLFISAVALILPNPRRRIGGHLLCRKCHYDLTGNQSGICPECGTPIAEVVHRQIAQQLDALSDDAELDGASLDEGEPKNGDVTN